MQVMVNGNPVDIHDGATAQEILAAAGFQRNHKLGLELPDGTLMHIADQEVIKPSPGDSFQAVPLASKGSCRQTSFRRGIPNADKHTQEQNSTGNL